MSNEDRQGLFHSNQSPFPLLIPPPPSPGRDLDNYSAIDTINMYLLRVLVLRGDLHQGTPLAHCHMALIADGYKCLHAHFSYAGRWKEMKQKTMSDQTTSGLPATVPYCKRRKLGGDTASAGPALVAAAPVMASLHEKVSKY